jgi:hypothetical protein
LSAILLSLLPNLEELHIEDFSPEDHTLTEHIFATAALCQVQNDLRPFSMQYLTSIAISSIEIGLGFDSIIPFLQLPSVKKAKIWGLNDDNDAAWYFPKVQNTTPEATAISDVLDLALYNSEVEGRAIVQFLKGFKCLKKFHYDHSGPASFDYYPIMPQDFGSGLAHLKPFLEELVILHDGKEISWDQRGEGPRSIGRLTGFERLKSITMNSDILLGFTPFTAKQLRLCQETNHSRQHLVEILPTSLQTLSITNCGLGILDQIHEIMTRKTLVPNLVAIELTYWKIASDTTNTAENEIPGYDKEVADKLKLNCVAAELILHFNFSNWVPKTRRGLDYMF